MVTCRLSGSAAAAFACETYGGGCEEAGPLCPAGRRGSARRSGSPRGRRWGGCGRRRVAAWKLGAACPSAGRKGGRWQRPKKPGRWWTWRGKAGGYGGGGFPAGTEVVHFGCSLRRFPGPGKEARKPGGRTSRAARRVTAGFAFRRPSGRLALMAQPAASWEQRKKPGVGRCPLAPLKERQSAGRLSCPAGERSDGDLSAFLKKKTLSCWDRNK